MRKKLGIGCGALIALFVVIVVVQTVIGGNKGPTTAGEAARSAVPSASPAPTEDILAEAKAAAAEKHAAVMVASPTPAPASSDGPTQDQASARLTDAWNRSDGPVSGNPAPWYDRVTKLWVQGDTAYAQTSFAGCGDRGVTTLNTFLALFVKNHDNADLGLKQAVATAKDGTPLGACPPQDDGN